MGDGDARHLALSLPLRGPRIPFLSMQIFWQWRHSCHVTYSCNPCLYADDKLNGYSTNCGGSCFERSRHPALLPVAKTTHAQPTLSRYLLYIIRAATRQANHSAHRYQTATNVPSTSEPRSLSATITSATGILFLPENAPAGPHAPGAFDCYSGHREHDTQQGRGGLFPAVQMIDPCPESLA